MTREQAPAPRPPLRGYGLYFTDSGRPTRRGPPFLCASDEDAVRSAEQRREGRAAELRCGDRVVAKWARRADPAEQERGS